MKSSRSFTAEAAADEHEEITRKMSARVEMVEAFMIDELLNLCFQIV